MERFKITPDGTLAAVSPTSSWLRVCRNAYALWRSSEITERGATAG